MQPDKSRDSMDHNGMVTNRTNRFIIVITTMMIAIATHWEPRKVPTKEIEEKEKEKQDPWGPKPKTPEHSSETTK